MSPFLQNKKVIAFFFLFAFLVFLCASIYIQVVRNSFASGLTEILVEQEKSLKDVALLTIKDGADSATEVMIKDCSLENRDRFDLLLGNLASLRGSELTEVEKLFDACADFYSLRKAVMVSKLERNFEIYKDLVLLEEGVKEREGQTTLLEKWETLVKLEKERSELGINLVRIQGEIIETLLAGISISSDEMQLLLVEGKETKEKLITIGSEIEKIANEVLSI